MTFEYYIKKDEYQYSNTTELILESCPEEERNNEKCFTRYCIENNDCYSYKCVNNTCIINEDFTTYHCFFDNFENKMLCGKTLYENCKNNEECYPGSCNEQNFCIDKSVPYISNGMKKDFFIFIFIIIIILILIVIVCHRKNKNKTFD
ncbi:hypothetical protein BCR36DRAFT_583102 [Piromyces finnis]|uniref:Uncharacterized protein n=1 Tax=Piromyces finnis TaxID=1754191 RepID=A0A1Y1VA44_9FUNG|nr:hypothetical protein BCR36DRAFT_583102 [Piromyces finnis]|eukprot:ORX51027.1 hypothetical protein BCR36DRAFT_583102 [Piromyces finnis]